MNFVRRFFRIISFEHESVNGYENDVFFRYTGYVGKAKIRFRLFSFPHKGKEKRPHMSDQIVYRCRVSEWSE